VAAWLAAAGLSASAPLSRLARADRVRSARVGLDGVCTRPVGPALRGEVFEFLTTWRLGGADGRVGVGAAEVGVIPKTPGRSTRLGLSGSCVGRGAGYMVV